MLSWSSLLPFVLRLLLRLFLVSSLPWLLLLLPAPWQWPAPQAELWDSLHDSVTLRVWLFCMTPNSMLPGVFPELWFSIWHRSLWSGRHHPLVSVPENLEPNSIPPSPFLPASSWWPNPIDLSLKKKGPSFLCLPVPTFSYLNSSPQVPWL